MDAIPSFKLILGSASFSRRKILEEMGYEFTISTADIDEKSIREEKPEDLVMTLAEAKVNFEMIVVKADAIIANLRTTTMNNQQDKDEEPAILVAADTVCFVFAFFPFFPVLRCFSKWETGCFPYTALIGKLLGLVSTQGWGKADTILQKLPISDYTKDAEPTLLITADQVVVYEGAIREKPASKEEAWEFIKGYSGGHAATVGSVLVTNLKTGFRKGEWDRVEIYFHEIPDEVIEKLIEEGIVLRVAGGLIIEHPLVLPYIKEVVGTTDSVMGLPKALTKKLIEEAL
ncbi:hypothetical protein POTOM_048824 [Populus tomentosa]|uniref:Maf-like protein n=1 Tax=Populus tomentosa TaxID=118781 RepID=A0A8X7YFX7_POPTO|nr:hypothetical protein POTOM_048824 [Populus tomentosa]